MSLEIKSTGYELTINSKVVKAKSLEDITVYMYKSQQLTNVKGQITSEWEKKQLKMLLGRVPEKQVFHLFVLYPYRATGDQEFRKNELLEHQDYMRGYLASQGVKYTFVVIEQCNDLPFNKGLLLNIGFNEIYNTWKKGKQTEHYIPYFCIHNSDLFPKQGVDEVNYSYASGFRDTYGSISSGIGGIVVFDYLSYLRINGHPNDYFGWGGEDMTVKNRINGLGIPLTRGTNYSNTQFVEERDHPRDSSQNNANLQKILTDDYTTNGTKQSRYTLISKARGDDVVYIKSTFTSN